MEELAPNYEEALSEVQSVSVDAPVPCERLSWPYIAGFFDGEGSLSIRGNKNGTFNMLQMAQSHDSGLRLLREIKEFLAKRGIKSGVYPGSKNRYALHVSNRRGISLTLRAMLPYLHIKRVIAQDVLRFFKMFPPRSSGRLLGTSISAGLRRLHGSRI